MKYNKEHYQVKVIFYYDEYNTMRGFETNNFAVAWKKFYDMKEYISTADKDGKWFLQLNRVVKNSVVPVVVTSSNGETITSPLI